MNNSLSSWSCVELLMLSDTNAAAVASSAAVFHGHRRLGWVPRGSP